MTRTEPLCVLTPRLTLVPFSGELLDLLLTDRAALEQRLSARFLPRWDDADQIEFLSGIRDAVRADPALQAWHIYFIVHDSARAVIGNVGFKGPPDRAGAVEIHYGLVAAYRRQGYGFEAVRALVHWAFTQRGVTMVTAVCDFDNAASIRVLQKLGMRRVRVTAVPLWWLWSGIRVFERAGMPGVSGFLRRLFRRVLRTLRRVGVRLNGPSLVWELPREGSPHHTEGGSVSSAR
jgi:ribosomal-protein-alanine N-acetyltransferase